MLQCIFTRLFSASFVTHPTENRNLSFLVQRSTIFSGKPSDRQQELRYHKRVFVVSFLIVILIQRWKTRRANKVWRCKAFPSWHCHLRLRACSSQHELCIEFPLLHLFCTISRCSTSEKVIQTHANQTQILSDRSVRVNAAQRQPKGIKCTQPGAKVWHFEGLTTNSSFLITTLTKFLKSVLLRLGISSESWFTASAGRGYECPRHGTTQKSDYTYLHQHLPPSFHLWLH